MEITGTRAMATEVIVDTITTTTPLVTMATVPDMITVSTDECVFSCKNLHLPVFSAV